MDIKYNDYVNETLSMLSDKVPHHITGEGSSVVVLSGDGLIKKNSGGTYSITDKGIEYLKELKKVDIMSKLSKDQIEILKDVNGDTNASQWDWKGVGYLGRGEGFDLADKGKEYLKQLDKTPKDGMFELKDDELSTLKDIRDKPGHFHILYPEVERLLEIGYIRIDNNKYFEVSGKGLKYLMDNKAADFQELAVSRMIFLLEGTDIPRAYDEKDRLIWLLENGFLYYENKSSVFSEDPGNLCLTTKGTMAIDARLAKIWSQKWHQLK